MTPDLLFVSGGTSALARVVIPAALQAGLRVRALRRLGDRSVEGQDDRVEWVTGDLLGKPAWCTALNGAAAVIHLAAAGKGSERDLRAVNVDATRNLLDKAARAGVGRFVHLSSTVVSEEDQDYYAVSKREAETLVRNSSVPWVIVRPTLMVGKGERNYLARVIDRVRRKGVMLIVGRCLVQPLFVEDVAQAIVATVTSSSAIGKTYELGGADSIPYDAFVRDIARAAGCEPPRMLTVPATPCLPVAALLDHFIGGNRFRTRVRYGARDHVYNCAAAHRDLGFSPEPWRSGIARRRLATESVGANRDLVGSP